MKTTTTKRALAILTSMSENIRHTGGSMRIETLRKLAGREEIDYLFLISALQEYNRPRDKISGWLKSGDLTRVKKGIYVFGKHVAHGAYSHAILANMIYGPSAVSLTYALSFYGLIPERVSTITSITSKRNKQFATPVGHFNYYFLPTTKYHPGIELHTASKDHSFFIASQEKALCDQIYIIDKKLKLNNITETEDYLLHDLRLDKSGLKKLDTAKFAKLAEIYQNSSLTFVSQFLKKWKK